MAIIRFLQVVALAILVVIIGYNYTPTNFNTSGELIDGNTMPIMALLAFLLVSSIHKIPSALRTPEIRNYILLYIGIVILSLIFYGIGAVTETPDIRAMFIPLMGLIIGYCLELSQRSMRFTLLCYMAIIGVVVVQQIMVNIGGFEIVDSYLANAKNAFGPMVCMAALASFAMALYPKTNLLMSILYALIAIALCVGLLTIRARFASVVLFALAFILIVRYIRGTSNSPKKVLLSVMIIGITGVLLLNETAQTYIFSSLFQNRETDITSGRTEAYAEAINVFLDNPWFGNLALQQSIGWAHNYLLLQLSNYGIIGGLPWIILYIYLAIKVIAGILKSDIFKIENIGWIFVAVSFFVSLAEPTYPYGPGTTNLIPFMLLGMALREKYNNITR